MNIFDILSPSGREENMVNHIREYAGGLGYATRKDNFGNLICEIGSGGQVAIECGMDSVCLMKTAEGDDGFVKVAVLNGGAVKELVGKKVKFLNGVCGIVRCDKTEDVEDFDLKVDIGECSAEGCAEKVPMGEFAALVCETFETENFIFGNGLSAFVPLMVVLEVMKTVKDGAFLFTAQKKFAGRGLKALFSEYRAKTVISVNTANEKGNIKCGKGAVVAVKENRTVPTVSVRKALLDGAKGKVQAGVIDEPLYLDLIQLSKIGAYCGGVCVAVRDKGKAYEGVAKDDIKSAIEIICGYLEDK